MREFNYEIVESLFVISESKSGWTKELNLVSFNGREAKYDIREWSPDHEKMGKGVSFTRGEIERLKEFLEIEL